MGFYLLKSKCLGGSERREDTRLSKDSIKILPKEITGRLKHPDRKKRMKKSKEYEVNR